MRFLIAGALALCLTSTSAQASDIYCQAYCGYYGTITVVSSYGQARYPRTDTEGQLVYASARNRTVAFRSLAEQCKSINKRYILYIDNSYRQAADPLSSCTRD